MAGIPGSKNIKQIGIAEYRRQMRKEAIQHLGGKCDNCGTTENLQFDHIDLKDGEKKRKLRSQGKWRDKIQSKAHLLKDENKNVRLLCKECHKKWSCAQRRAAFALLASLPLEEQIKLTNDEL